MHTANILLLHLTSHQVVDKYWLEPYGDRRQEIVFIGSRTMQQQRIVDALNDALLTDAEFKRGPKAWAKLHDPIAVLSDDDVMEFLEADEDDDDDASSSDDDAAAAAPAKRGRSASKSEPHVHDESCSHHSLPAKKAAAVPAAAKKAAAVPAAAKKAAAVPAAAKKAAAVPANRRSSRRA